MNNNEKLFTIDLVSSMFDTKNPDEIKSYCLDLDVKVETTMILHFLGGNFDNEDIMEGSNFSLSLNNIFNNDY